METAVMLPGDVALYRARDARGFAIAMFTRSPYCHIRLITDEDGSTVEADFKGAIRGHVEKGDVIVSVPLTGEQRAEIVAVAASMVGTPYGFLDILALALATVGVRSKWLRERIRRSDQLICSQLVDVAWQRVGFHAFNLWTDPDRPLDGPRLPQDVTPGDIADLAFTNGWPAHTHDPAQTGAACTA